MNRKELVREYKESKLPMGLFQIKNTTNGKVFIGTSVNLPGILNRMRWQLEMGGHSNRLLQQEWNQFGAGAYTFEVLDTLKHPDTDDYNPTKDLEALMELWLEKLKPYEEHGYHKQPQASNAQT
jgi:hypothetical protein